MSLGDTCTCGSTGPAGSPVYSPTSSYACAGNSAESCGAPGYAIIYKLSPRNSGYSPTTYTSAPSGGQVTTKVSTTTDSFGHTTIVTTASSFPTSSFPSPPGGTTKVYTTTDSAGHTSVITSVINNPIITPLTTLTGDQTISVIADTTTDSQGHTITSTHTVLTALPTASSGSSGSSGISGNPINPYCPSLNGQYYLAGNSIYQISCSTDYPGDDLASVHADSLPQCYLACSNYAPQQSVQGGKPCIAASWIAATGSCYLKYNIEEVNPFDGGIISGRQIHFALPAGLRTVSASSFHIETSTSPSAPQSSIRSSMALGFGSTPIPQTQSSSATQASSGSNGLGSTPVSHISSGSATQGPTGGSASGSISLLPGASGSANQGASVGSGSISASAPPNPSSSATPGTPVVSGPGTTPIPPSSYSSAIQGPSGASGSSSMGGGSSTNNPNTIPTSSVNSPCPSCDGQNYILSTNGDVYEIECGVNYPGNDLYTPSLDSFNDCIFACDTYSGQQSCVAATWEESTGVCHLKSAITDVDYNAVGFDSAHIGSYIASSGIPSMASMSSPGSLQAIVSQQTDPTSVSSDGSATTITSSAASPAAPSGSSLSVYTSSETMTYHPIVTQASCPRNDFGQETDPLTVVYNVNCDRSLAGNSLPPMHADNVDACFQACDMFTGCAGVNYDDSLGGIPISSNCYQYSSVLGYTEHALSNTSYAALSVYGPNTAANGDNVATDYQDDLCTDPNYGDQSTYTNIYGVSYLIRCNYGFSSATNLVGMASDSLLSCLSYCTLYSTCVGVIFSGPNGPPPVGQINCQPLSAHGSDQAMTNVAYAAVQ